LVHNGHYYVNAVHLFNIDDGGGGANLVAGIPEPIC
jgi:hypothetical protein